MFWADRDPASDARTFLATEDRALTYAQAFDAADALFDTTRGGVVAILCDKTPETVIAYVGALRAGCVPLLLDVNAPQAAVSRTLEAYKPTYVFAPLSCELGPADRLKIIGTHGLFKSAGSEPAELFEDLALLLPTSGSTGDPKCVRIAARHIISCTDAVCDYLSMDQDRTAVSLLPLHYSYGLSVLHNSMSVRGKLAMTDLSVLDREFWGFMQAQRVTDLAGVPFIFDVLRRMTIPEDVVRNLACVTQAGGRLDPRITKHFLDRFADTGISYFTMYGQTEATPRISYVPPDKGIEKLGSVGIPISCGAVDIDGGSEGELIYRGKNVALGYAHSWKDLALGDDFGGVLKTGDLAQIDEEGYITITGRLKRFVKLNGVSVNLDHVESVLQSTGLRCLVAGQENKIIVCYRDTAREAVDKAVTDNFGFHPSTVSLHEVADFPLTGAGKPDYASVLKEFGGGRR
ncbi:MAG: AMP-binding protein [Pseudomonadota bacterium]